MCVFVFKKWLNCGNWLGLVVFYKINCLEKVYYIVYNKRERYYK